MLCRGMHTFPLGTLKLNLSSYLVRAKLPVLPKGKFGHANRDQPPGGWGMLGNDNIGNCVVVGAMHEHMLMAWATGRPIPKFTEMVARDQYFQLTGGKDTGLDPVTTAWYRQQNGFLDANMVAHKIDAFVQIQNPDELKLATYMFGVAGMCWQLPDSAEDSFMHQQPWGDTASAPGLGHYTPCVGQNSKGLLQFVTWGRLQGATLDFTVKYWNPGGCIAYLSREYLLATGRSPEGIDWDGLQEDLQSVQYA